jgi:excisionase family DNA binding protein
MSDHNEIDNMLTPREVAGLLHIHPNTLKRWSEKGRIRVFRINPRGDRRYRRADIARFLAEFNPSRDSAKKVH